jgi:hypothetical protein
MALEGVVNITPTYQPITPTLIHQIHKKHFKISKKMFSDVLNTPTISTHKKMGFFFHALIIQEGACTVAIGCSKKEIKMAQFEHKKKKKLREMELPLAI